MLKTLRLIILGSLLAGILTHANAQFTLYGGTNLSNISWVDFGGDIEFKFSPKIQLGFEAPVVKFEKANIATGLEYIVRGSRIVDPTANFVPKGIDQIRRLSIRYLNIPIIVNYYSKESGSSRLKLSGGFYFGRALSGSEKIKAEGMEDREEIIKFNSGVRAFRYGDFGMTLRCGIETQKLLLQLRYDHGIADIFGEGDGDDENIYNRTIALSIGLLLNKKGA